MKLIIDIPEEVLTAIQNGEDYRYDIHTTIAQGIPYEPKGDLISREDLKENEPNYDEEGYRIFYESEIDNAPTVETEITEKQAILFLINNGWLVNHDKELRERWDRLQGENVPISKLRLMSVEECAGHTIEYAMGWKACVEWIKKGGA